ncbi:hypothetical protein HID58_010106, partial [Brassica napus]
MTNSNLYKKEKCGYNHTSWVNVFMRVRESYLFLHLSPYLTYMI